MTLHIILRWAGACGAVAAIAAFDTVVISGLCAIFGVRSECGVCKNRACPTLANCRGDTGYPVCVAVCLPAVWVSVMASKKFPAPKRSEGGAPKGLYITGNFCK
jgi:bacterioferritin-associated ferredoxin